MSVATSARCTVLAFALIVGAGRVHSGAAGRADEGQTMADEEAQLRGLQAAIKGREGDRASIVFKNVQLLGDMPAGRLLRVMQAGYARSLGVSCDHCHVVDDWASDAKDAKRIARGMGGLVDDLNSRALRQIAGLAARQPVVNCTTCHRGEIKPALNLPVRPGA